MSLRNLQLNWLRTFEAVGRLLSFSAAATNLNISQSAVSQQIGLLELKVGRKLFVRQRRCIELTVAGRAYLGVVREALQHIEHGTASIFSTVAQGVLELRVNNTFAQLWLAPRFQRFCTLYPRVSVRMYGVNWEVEEPNSTTELEIRYGVGVWPGFEVTELLPRGLRPYCSRAAANALRDRKLLNFPLIDVLGTPVGWSEWLAQHSPNGKEPRQRLYVDSYAIAADMAGHGVGVCLLNEEFVNGSRLHNVLVGPLDQCVADQAGFYLVRPREKSISGAAKAFSEWVKTEKNGPAAVPSFPASKRTSNRAPHGRDTSDRPENDSD
jgi:LysR family transcriptional regulator, glycine cleavage system transcriptional activator